MSFNLLIGVPTYIYILVSLWNFQPFNYFLWNSLKNKLGTLVLSFLFFILFPGLSINFILFNDFFFIRLLLRFHFPFYSPPQSLAFCFFHFPPVLIFLFLMPPPLPAIPLSVPLHQTLRQPKHLAIIQCLMAFTCYSTNNFEHKVPKWSNTTWWFDTCWRISTTDIIITCSWHFTSAHKQTDMTNDKVFFPFSDFSS